MVCPKCNGDSKVAESRSEDKIVFRRRKCLTCDHLFYTVEKEVSEPSRVKRRMYLLQEKRYGKKDERLV